LRLIASLLAAVVLLAGSPAPAAEPATIVLGTHQSETTFQGRWLRRIYAEAFRRIGVPLQVSVVPLQRLSVLVDQGGIDGDVGRVHAYADAHPDQVRVEEPMYSMVFGLYSTDATLRLKRLEDLRTSGLRGIYPRGVAICENTLRPLLPPDRLLDVTESEQAFDMMLAGRSDFFCTSDLGVLDVLYGERFRHVAPLPMLIAIKDVPIHAYLHRRHAALAPRLAAALAQMRAEGLIERYRLDALKQLGR
jgi:hypothetical protein